MQTLFQKQIRRSARPANLGLKITKPFHKTHIGTDTKNIASATMAHPKNEHAVVSLKLGVRKSSV